MFALRTLPVAIALIFGQVAWADPPINPSGASGLPIHGVVTNGTATGAVDGNQLTITQSSHRAVINWDSFNINAEKTVHFQQSVSDAVLNRITGDANPSQILGNLTADGMVMLMNPNGIMFGRNAVVNVGALIATTGSIDVDQFTNHDKVVITGAIRGSILNQGHITALNAGLVALVAPSVTNQGTITATGGRVALSGTDAATISLNGLYEFAVPAGAVGGSVSNAKETGSSLEASLNGAIINLSTGDAANLVSGVINLEGIQQATSAIIVNGDTVVLKSDLQAPTIAGSSNKVEVYSGAQIQDAVNIAKTGTPGAGASVDIHAGTYTEQVTLNKANMTLTGQEGAKMAVPDAAQVNGIAIAANNVTLAGLEIAGPVNSPYYDYYASGTQTNISRGIVVGNGITGFTISNNNIHDVRNGILVDGRNNTGSVTGNRIENTKSGISVQYTDSTGVAISGNSQGPVGNEWGLNLHLNGFWDPVTGTIKENKDPYIQNAPTSVWQQALLDLSAANAGWAVQDQGYKSSNRTQVMVATTGSASNQGSRLTPINTIQNGVDAVVAGGTVNVAAGTYMLSTRLDVNKPLTLLGVQHGVDPRNAAGLRTAGSSTETIVDGGGTLPTLLRIGGNNVTVDGFEFRNGTGDLLDSNVSISTPVIRYSLIHGSSGDEGVQLRNSTNAVLEYNRVYNTVGDGLNLTDSSNGTIRFNEVNDNNSDNAAIYVYGSTNTRIEGNYVHDVHVNDGIKLGDKDGNDANKSGGTISDNVVVVDNTAGGDGITVYTSGVTVSGNQVTSSHSPNGAIYVDYNVNNVTIQNNTIKNSGSLTDGVTTYGIRVGQSTHSPNVTISGNTFVNNEAQLFYNNPSSGKIATIFNTNTFDRSVMASGDNRIWSNIRDGINVAANGSTVSVGAGTYAENVSITKALTLDGAGAGHSVIDPTSGDAVTISSNIGASAAVVIDGFTFTAPHYGVNVVGSGTSATTLGQLTIQNSDFRNNGQNGFIVSGGATTGAPGLAKVSLLSDTFENNGTVNVTSLGYGDILFNYYNGNATLKNLHITGNGEYIGIQMRGASPTANVPQNAGTVAFDNVAIDGSFRRPSGVYGTWNPGGPGDAIHLLEYASVANVSFNDVVLNPMVGHGMFLEGMGSTLNIGNTTFGVPDTTITGSGTSTISRNIFVGSNSNNLVTNVNATSATFTGAADGFAVEDRVLHALDVTGLGLVTWNAGNLYVTPASGSIQRGINAASAGNTVNVNGGTYAEQLAITKSLSLVGAGRDVTFIAPPSLTADASGMRNILMIGGNGSTNAEVSGFTLRGPVPDINSGIIVRDGAYAYIHDNALTDIRESAILSGNQRGQAIWVGRAEINTSGRALIDNNVITGYQKGGIVVDGTGSQATIRGNTVTGDGPTGANAQNGIQVSRGANANVDGNTISKNEYTGTSWWATGILVYRSNDSVISNNTVNANQVGIDIQEGSNNTVGYNTIAGATANGIYSLGSSGNTFSGNNISGVHAPATNDGWGIALDGGSGNNTVSANTVQTSDVGLWVGNGSDNNTFTGNIVSGNGTGAQVATYDGGAAPAGLQFHSNSFTGNTTAEFTNNTTVVADASGNWWGMTDATAVASVVTGPVDFTPYLGSGVDATPGTAGFQGNLSTLYVTALGAQTGSAGRILEGVNMAATGGTVNVGGGTYAEDVTIGALRNLMFGGSTVHSLTFNAEAGGSGIGGRVTADNTVSGFLFNAPINLLSDTMLATNGGNIALNGHIQNADGVAHSLTLHAGSGATRGNVSMVSGGTESNPLGQFEVVSNDFTLLSTLWVMGYGIDAFGNVALSNHTLRAQDSGITNIINAVGNVTGTTVSNGSSQISSILGDVAANVSAQGAAVVSGNNISGTIAANSVTVDAVNTVNAIVSAASNAMVSGNTITGIISAPTASLDAVGSVQVTLNAGSAVVHSDAGVNLSGSASSVVIDAPNGTISGSFGQVSNAGSGLLNVNGKPEINQTLSGSADNSRVVPSDKTISNTTSDNASVAQRAPTELSDFNLLPPTGAGGVTIVRGSPAEAGEFIAQGRSAEIDLSPRNEEGEK